ncbi:methylglyoxal reductase (NADPH-dependent) gre2 [Tulasnella sp. 418]|nr:methylglyoxal reductase (NADPH-dependent) gre2 [Tulasnella sp. 418]
MPAVQPPSRVLVTGASGFIAVWVVKTLLERGYSVVGTVRSEEKGVYLRTLFKEHGDSFSYTIIEDIEKDGAFDEAVRGIDAVEHTASPFHFRADDPQELIRPAVKGTVNVLESIKNHGPSVKRVVITASTACIMWDKGVAAEFDESDWNITSPAIVEKLGKDAPGPDKYRTSKVFAERAAWDFMEKNKSIGFDLVTVCPPIVLGPIMQQVDSVSALNTSIAGFYQHTTTSIQKEQKDRVTPVANWVDVRDVALIHALSLEKEEAGGKRFITSSGPLIYQNVLDALHSAGEYPDVPKGEPGAGKLVKADVFKSDKAIQVFGIKFKTMEETAVATLTALRERSF